MKKFYFDKTEELEKELATTIANSLKKAITLNNVAYLLVSGGGTPKKMYTQLAQLDIPWEKVHIGLVDERFVTTDSNDSNEKMIKEHLLIAKASVANFYGMIANINDEKDNITLINQKYNEVFKDITVVLLGMGGDGHTASLFPSDPASEENLQQNKVAIINTKAPKAPVQRITCSKQMLLNANKVLLMTTGKEKYEVLNNNDKRTLPIFSFVDNKKDIEWYYSI
ncbi:6-phosphogluconolactonase [Tenacibaculum pacificus]|uniref:6-phosphogluconolactonase n=1 Tax=Tenacibaculum pacificus TaxID=3018314 RepID=UPI0022F3D693|nr:6-phosphogluconolactonase [Tenacibaculum pacificus]WBX73956.1 6-phosphogluconolactonase [Tenacibaculum pacificus]